VEEEEIIVELWLVMASCVSVTMIIMMMIPWKQSHVRVHSDDELTQTKFARKMGYLGTLP
jgi:hypothetical protein